MAEVDPWLTKIAADIVPVDAELADLATQAWLIYGKDCHLAALSLADCCSYVVGLTVTTNPPATAITTMDHGAGGITAT